MNFRVKLNLSKFYQDVRRSSWIFIDSTKMLQIAHVKDHICKLFNIKQPCHLLVNDTDYLPPNEDIRVLRANETIIVAPGSGLEFDKGLDEKTGMSKNQDVYDRLREVIPVYHKAAQTDDVIELKAEPVAYNHQDISNIPSNGCLSQQDEYDSTLIGDTEFESVNESKNIESNQSDNTSMTQGVPRRKRTRVRTRKSKNVKCNGVKSYEENNEHRPKKPKVIDSQIISSGKHTRFNFMEDEINIIDTNSPETLTSNTSTIASSHAHSLKALVALGEHNPPLTFAKAKVKEEVKVESVWDYNSRSFTNPKNSEAVSTPASPEDSERGPPAAENKDILELNTMNGKITVSTDYEKRPIITVKPKLDDIIAFKMLKFGEDCTPRLSNFIVGTVVAVNSQTLVYYLKIIDGVEEIQIPTEDYLPHENDSEPCQAVIKLNYSNILVPRLLFSANS